MADTAGNNAVTVVWTELDALEGTPGELPEPDRSRAAAMVPAIGTRWARGRLWLRRTLSAHLDIPTPALTLRATSSGQPIVEGSALTLSITHSNRVIACALSAHPVGIDVEPRPQFTDDLVGLATVVGSSAEINQIRELDGETRVLAFQRWWVRKEAVLKAAGTGFAVDPRGVHIGVTSLAPPEPWSIHDIGEVVDGEFCAIATACQQARITVVPA